MAQPADHAPYLASSSALRVELDRREAEGAGVTPHGPSAQHVGADTQPPTFESRAGLERPLTARRHRHEHDHDPRRRVDQRESTLSQHDGLQVEDLRPTGHHDQIGDSRRLHDRGSRPRRAVEDDVGDALRPSSVQDTPYPIRSDGRHDRLVSLPTAASTAARRPSKSWGKHEMPDHPVSVHPPPFDYDDSIYRAAAEAAKDQTHGHCRKCGRELPLEAHHWTKGPYPPPHLTTANDLTAFCRDCHDAAHDFRFFLDVGGAPEDYRKACSETVATLLLRPEAVRRSLMRVGRAVRCEGRWAALVTGGASEVRQDLRALNADVQELGERVTRVEVRIEGLAQHHVGGGGAPTVAPPGNDD